MNKKDCEHIGYILSTVKSFEELKQDLFKMDDRIEPEYIAFEEIHGRSEKVDILAEKLMTERNKEGLAKIGWGNKHWSMIKKEHLQCSYKQCLEDARKEVYGDDYHPSLFRN